MTDIGKAGQFQLGDRIVNRMGYGAMQLAGPGVFGPPKDRSEALAVLREAVERGVNHIDTSDFYGPHVTNQLIRESLHPYPRDLTIVTKVGAVRGADASWNPAQSPSELTKAVHDNLRNLGVDALDVVNLRIVGAIHAPSGFDRGTTHDAGRSAKTGTDPAFGPQQCHPGAGGGGPRDRQNSVRAEPLQSGPSR